MAKDKDTFDYTVLCVRTGDIWQYQLNILPHWFRSGDLITIDSDNYLLVNKSWDMDSDMVTLYVKSGDYRE